jgi:LAO/AO transport system ATPase
LALNMEKKPRGINPQAARLISERHRKLKPAKEYIEGILAGDRVALGQAITLVESETESHRQLAQEIIAGCLPHSGYSIRIGITGSPGVGKSTFIESLGLQLIEEGQKLGVLAIDPSSQVSRGSILGDKTRMNELSRNPAAFIRPSAAGSSLGGVARKTRETIILCEAAGFNVILIETVGVGQSEIAVHSMTDFFLLLLLPGGGDELQGIKRGIVEMADLLVVTKPMESGKNWPLKAVRLIGTRSTCSHPKKMTGRPEYSPALAFPAREYQKSGKPSMNSLQRLAKTGISKNGACSNALAGSGKVSNKD